MKSTKIMLAVIATFLLTWLLLSSLVYLLSHGLTLKEVCGHSGIIMTMIIIGWLPSLIVASDLAKEN